MLTSRTRRSALAAQRWRTVWAAVVVLMLLPAELPGQAAPAPPYDQFEFLLPIDFTEGLVTDRGHPLPFTFSTRVYPSVVLDGRGKLRAGASTALTYQNPSWEFLVGPRLAYRLIDFGGSLAGGLGVEAAVEGLFGTDGGDEVAAELVFDLDGLFRLGIRGGRDVSRDRYRVEGVIGADPFSWFSSPKEDP